MDRIKDARRNPFFLVDNALIEREDFTIYEKMVYVVLCKYAGQDGSAFPSYSTIAKKCGCSRRKAIEAVQALIDKGVLRKEIRKNDKDEHISNLYSIIGVEYGAQDAPPSAHGAPPPSAHHAPPGAPCAPKKETIKNKQSFKNNQTTTNGNNVVVLRHLINNKINFDLPDKTIINLCEKVGFQRVLDVLLRFDSLVEGKTIKNLPGFFIMACIDDYKIKHIDYTWDPTPQEIDELLEDLEYIEAAYSQ